MTHLTDNEIEALKMCLNYDSRESQLEDNMTCAGAEEFSAMFGGNMQAAGGLISSLEQKGMGGMDEEDDMFWMTEDGVNAIFDIIEAE